MSMELGVRVQVYMEGRVISRTSTSAFSGVVATLPRGSVHLLSCRPSTPVVLIIQFINFRGTNRTVHLKARHRFIMGGVDMERRVISRTSSSVFSGAVDDFATCNDG